MAFDRTKRNRYYDAPTEFPHSSRNHAEDLIEHHLPNERMQNAHLHVWGIGRGLQVDGVAGNATVTVQPGLAIDAEGRMIALSAEGHADVGANPPGNQHAEISVPAAIDLTTHNGQMVYLTIAFAEVLRPAEGSGGRLEVVPWIRLQPVGGAGGYVHDGASVILAIVDIDGAGNLIALNARDNAVGFGRRVLGHSVEEVEIRRAENSADSVQETRAASLGPRTGGGLEVNVPANGDGVHIGREGGGRFNDLDVEATHLRVKDGNGRDALHLNSSNAVLQVGTTSNEGDLEVHDGQDRSAIHLDGGSATLRAGTAGNAGEIDIRDGQNRSAMHFSSGIALLRVGVNGNEGDLEVQDGQGRTVMLFNGGTADLRLGDKGNAADITMRDASDRIAFHLDGANAVLNIGAQGNEGDIRVRDQAGNNAFDFNGSNAVLVIGASNNEGDIQIRNNQNANSITMDGGSGNLTANGLIRANGSDILGANPTRKVRLVNMVTSSESSQYVLRDVDIGYRTRFLAFTCVMGLDPLGFHDKYDAWITEVYRIDGERRGRIWSGGRHWGPTGDYKNVRPGVVRSTGQVVQFRARAYDNVNCFAIGVIIYE